VKASLDGLLLDEQRGVDGLEVTRLGIHEELQRQGAGTEVRLGEFGCFRETYRWIVLMHAQLVDLRGVGKPSLAEVLLDVAPGRGNGSFRLPLTFVGRALGGTSTAGNR